MQNEFARELLGSLLSSAKPSEIRLALSNIGDHAEISVGEEFGSEGLSWQFYGANESNMATINMGSDPGRSLIERVTNAIDAVLEREKYQRTGDEPKSPEEAAASWFGRPSSTPYAGIFSWDGYQATHYDRMINVVLLEGDQAALPTIDIVDQGLGIEPAEFHETILSLHRGNKIQKRYLAGAYGQGGSTTLAFCQYTLIVSRFVGQAGTVGFTLVRLMNLGEQYKEDAYAYLSVSDDDGNLTVPSFSLDEPIDLYPSSPVDRSLHSFEYGTLVRHFGYDLHNFDKTLGPTSGNLYHLLHYLMFDPLFPFRVMDLRTQGSEKDELVTGTRNRLMRLLKQETPAEPGKVAGSLIRHYSPREMVSPLSEDEPSVGIEYWVVQNYRKVGEKIRLRAYSNELYLDRYHPIVGTLNGQNHGELTPLLFRELQLSMTSRHLVMHIDITKASKNVRKELIASTRQGFKKGKALNELKRILRNRLKEDVTLYEIERELVDNLLAKDSKEIDDDVKKEITVLLRDAGFKVKDPGEVLGNIGDGDLMTTQTTATTTTTTTPEDLPTLEYPAVTRFEIVFPSEQLAIPKPDNRLVRVETDANYRFDRENRIAIRSEPDKLEVASKLALHGGRMHWRLRPSELAEVGDVGKVVATLTKPDGQQLVATIPFKILPPREVSDTKSKGLVPPFQIIPVDPFDEPDQFETIWPEVDKDQITSVAYRTVRAGDEMRVYYSTGFAPYRQQIESIKERVSLAELFRKHYQIWIGYHAILQNKEREVYEQADLAEPDRLTSLLERERALVATMQAKQAVRSAELQKKVLAVEAIE